MKKAVLGLLSVATLLFFFQNCGKAGFENADINTTNSASSIDPKLANLPFPYDITINQIAHMSCPISNAQSGLFFSWKVGAFDNVIDNGANMSLSPAGLRLSNDFLTEWNKVSASYNPSIQNARLKEALTLLPSVAGTKLQMSFRKTNTPQTDFMMLPSGGNSPAQNFLTDMSSGEIADNFLSQAGGIFNFFPTVQDFYSRSLEASMTIPSSYGPVDDALKSAYDASFLTIGFEKPADPSTGTSDLSLAAPSSDNRYAYGKGYRVHFGVANPQTTAVYYPPRDSLAYVEEYDLNTGYRTPGVGWDCSYKFKIVRPDDRTRPMYRANHFMKYNGACPTPKQTGDYCASQVDQTFGVPTSAFPSGVCPSNRPLRSGEYCPEEYWQTCPEEPYQNLSIAGYPAMDDDGLYNPAHPERPAILHALRRFLPADQWDINVSRKCIVPKYQDTACYGNSKIIYDEYFFSNPSLDQSAGCGGTGYYQCAGYLTLCVRR